MRAWIPALGAQLAAAMLGACAIDFPTIRDAEQICSPGENVFCRCPGGDPGTRHCESDGTSFGECVVAPGTPCGAEDVAVPPGSPPPVPPGDNPGTKDAPTPPGEGGSPGAGGAGGGPGDNCGTVDYFGECNGTQLAWCDQGQLVETDCAASDKVCELVSDTIGYDCVTPPDPCEGLTAVGECQGDTLRYCLSEQITEVDCTAQNQVCGYSDTYSFYDCLDPPPP